MPHQIPRGRYIIYTVNCLKNMAEYDMKGFFLEQAQGLRASAPHPPPSSNQNFFLNVESVPSRACIPKHDKHLFIFIWGSSPSNYTLSFIKNIKVARTSSVSVDNTSVHLSGSGYISLPINFKKVVLKSYDWLVDGRYYWLFCGFIWLNMANYNSFSASNRFRHTLIWK